VNPSESNTIFMSIIHRYVQHLIRREKSLLKQAILQRGGFFFVSGSSKNMPTAVKEALEEAIEDKDYVEHMIKSGRYQEETWA
jgi:sulfite reductase alpha subunit-like flavoprotein